MHSCKINVYDNCIFSLSLSDLHTESNIKEENNCVQQKKNNIYIYSLVSGIFTQD